MTLAHIALSVNDFNEIKDFYEDILSFTFRYKFKIDDALSHTIFNMRGDTDVYIVEQQDTKLEIFLTQRKEKKAFAHVCLCISTSGMVYEKAKKSGYRTRVKDNGLNNTYFIWDKSGNLFEIKDCNNQNCT